MLFSSSVFPQMNPNKQINLDTNLFDLNESKLFSKTEVQFSFLFFFSKYQFFFTKY